MIKKLLIATKNVGKFNEIAEVLKCAPTMSAHAKFVPIQLLSLANVALEDDDVEETGETHEENAILKARYFYDKTNLPTLGEDSGIEVDAFPGELGVVTRRWSGLKNASDEEWIKVFLEKMKHLIPTQRGAKFICCAAVILDRKSRGNPYIFRGETKGVITQNLEAPLKPGIPISSCFKPEGLEKVYAALSVEEKNRVSHRGKAMTEVAEFLTNIQFLFRPNNVPI